MGRPSGSRSLPRRYPPRALLPLGKRLALHQISSYSSSLSFRFPLLESLLSVLPGLFTAGLPFFFSVRVMFSPFLTSSNLVALGWPVPLSHPYPFSKNGKRTEP